MASAFGHAFTAYALGHALDKQLINWKVFGLGMLCSILPDADVIAFSFGIPYDSIWGHRGFTHSFVFSFVWGTLMTMVFFPKINSLKLKISLILFFSISTASHAILDAMTNGGLGVAFFFPFDNSRYFLPWQVIQVSPIGVENFFTAWGVRVILSELVWIGIPGILFIFIIRITDRLKRRKS